MSRLYQPGLPLVSMIALLSLALLGAGAPAYADPPPNAAPQFSDYPITRDDLARTGVHPKVRLNSPLARRYTTVIHQEFTQPPNFSGHFRVARWGCGTDCRNFAVLDQNTGSTFTLPGVEEIAGVMGNDEERVDFRPDSRLLIISGCINDGTAPGKFYYLWTGKRLQRIGSAPLVVEPIDTTPVDVSAP